MIAALNVGTLLMFKRNQVEEAIANVLEPGSAKASPAMRTRLKRLLETDRSFGRTGVLRTRNAQISPSMHATRPGARARELVYRL